MVLNEPLPVEVTDLLARRRALGQDLFDEVRDGEHHMNAAPDFRLARLESSLHVILRPCALAAGLVPGGQFDIEEGENDFRVPDLGVLRRDTDETWVRDAAIVVEISSPNDESWQKFDHFARFGVVEIFMVDPNTETVRIFTRRLDDAEFSETGRSDLLGFGADWLADQLDW